MNRLNEMRIFTRRHALRAQKAGQGGQVLIFALIAMVVILVAVLLLFDIHTVIRGKIKAQSAVDSAALSGAKWQLNTLNLIGELNIVKATSILISDESFGISEDGSINVITHVKPADSYRDDDGYFREDLLISDLRKVEEDKTKLRSAVELISQMQTRVSFVCPLIGYGAAQQAAKNNGLDANDDASEVLSNMYNDICDTSLYGNPDLAPQSINSYAWRLPYSEMIRSLLTGTANSISGKPNGIAVGTNEHRLGTPYLSSSPPNAMLSYLASQRFYEAVLANSWCELQDILGKDFTGCWWGSFDCEYNQSFIGESELLPVHVDFFTGSAPYRGADLRKIFKSRFNSAEGSGESAGTESLDPFPLGELFDAADPYPYEIDSENDTFTLNLYRDSDGKIIVNPNDTDLNYNILPEITWCVYDDHWSDYDSEQIDYWKDYLRDSFKPGYEYYSGAKSWFDAAQNTVTLTGNISDTGDSSKNIGNAFQFNQSASSDIVSAENNLRNSVHSIEADAMAKPFGRIHTEDGYKPPFHAGNLILPVFTEIALLPVSLEPRDGISQLDLGWIYFLTEYIPLLSKNKTLEDQWSAVSAQYPQHAARYFSYYHRALLKLRDPDWHQQGLDWLNTPAQWHYDTNGEKVITKYNKDLCDDWNPPSGGSGTRKGPGKLH